MKIKDYLKQERLSPDQFGRMVGVDGSTVRRWIAGDSRPRWRILAKITRQTNGLVRGADFEFDGLASEDHQAA